MPLYDLPGLDLLATPAILVDITGKICFMNQAAEDVFTLNRRVAIDQPLKQVLPGLAPLIKQIKSAVSDDLGFIEHELTVPREGDAPWIVSCIGTPVYQPEKGVLLEMRPIDQERRIEREERLLHDQLINRELIRNLAHEIRNPLGGIRGAAQLLERELSEDGLKEYTQVIRKEADRLHQLMDRMLSPVRLPRSEPVNVHEVLERVRSLLLAEYPDGIQVIRDYDISLPEILGDLEQLIQAVLNVSRNAAQALNGRGTIRFKSRAARQVTIGRKRFRLALVIDIIDNGPGIPDALQKRMFHPLVSGREGGSGLGLMLAQNFVNQHQGLIKCSSVPGKTCFSLILPVPDTEVMTQIKDENAL
jgi:two-component system nitrogen regulation sensor histidine kinase GlnL